MRSTSKEIGRKSLMHHRRDRDFHLLNGEKVSTPFMTSMNYQFFGSFDGFKLVKIPYQKGEDGRQFSMSIFLPNERDGLQSLIQQFESNNWFLHHLSELRKVELDAFWIPKFKFPHKMDAKKTIKELGLTRPFKYHEELTVISNTKGLVFSEIFQTCYIEVNEEGTEAAAAAYMGKLLCRSGYMAPKPTFVADHPFIFMSREESFGVVLFTGAVINPLLKG
ncbi:serpin-ZXA-like [Cornus florida]|uniref:serpin-ZXA-like n=1 Tax=Cornus florida TaxID=4283 RepID=UPI0028A108EF|nr:serpin-ZXA-like [Cornus florida]